MKRAPPLPFRLCSPPSIPKSHFPSSRSPGGGGGGGGEVETCSLVPLGGSSLSTVRMHMPTDRQSDRRAKRCRSTTYGSTLYVLQGRTTLGCLGWLSPIPPPVVWLFDGRLGGGIVVEGDATGGGGGGERRKSL